MCLYEQPNNSKEHSPIHLNNFLFLNHQAVANCYLATASKSLTIKVEV